MSLFFGVSPDFKDSFFQVRLYLEKDLWKKNLTWRVLESIDCCFRSCVLQCKGTCSRVSMDTPDQGSWLTSWTILLIDVLIDTGSTLNRTLDQEPVDSWAHVDRLICIDRKLVNSQLTVDQVWIKRQLSLNWGVYGVSIKSIDREYQSTLDRFVDFKASMRLVLQIFKLLDVCFWWNQRIPLFCCVKSKPTLTLVAENGIVNLIVRVSWESQNAYNCGNGRGCYI